MVEDNPLVFSSFLKAREAEESPISLMNHWGLGISAATCSFSKIWVSVQECSFCAGLSVSVHGRCGECTQDSAQKPRVPPLAVTAVCVPARRAIYLLQELAQRFLS